MVWEFKIIPWYSISLFTNNTHTKYSNCHKSDEFLHSSGFFMQQLQVKLLAELRTLLTTLLQLYIMHIYSKNRGDEVNILIDNKSGAPIYDQIYSQIKRQIISGALQEDEMLPSIRGLAKDLRISFITTKRAYEELEKDGFIYTLPGKGCYVAPKNVELLREENLKKIEEHIDEIVRLAATCNLSKQDIIEMVNFGLEEQ